MNAYDIHWELIKASVVIDLPRYYIRDLTVHDLKILVE